MKPSATPINSREVSTNGDLNVVSNRANENQRGQLRRISRDLDRFVKNGLKSDYFTEALYAALTVDLGFNPGFDLPNFYQVRFRQEADRTLELLSLVSKQSLKAFAETLAAAVKLRLRPTTDGRWTVEDP